MPKRGAKNKYETNVKPRFNEIKKLVEDGATDKEVIELLKISKNAFYDYMNKHKEFYDLMRGYRGESIQKLKDSLFKKAIGFQYEERKKVIDSDGTIKEEIYIKTSLPSETAILILLKHWDKEKDGSPKWMNDPATFKLKQEELEFKKENFESDNW